MSMLSPKSPLTPPSVCTVSDVGSRHASDARNVMAGEVDNNTVKWINCLSLSLRDFSILKTHTRVLGTGTARVTTKSFLAFSKLIQLGHFMRSRLYCSLTHTALEPWKLLWKSITVDILNISLKHTLTAVHAVHRLQEPQRMCFHQKQEEFKADTHTVHTINRHEHQPMSMFLK